MTPEAIYLSAYLSDSKTMGLLAAEQGLTTKHFADGRLAQVYRIALDYATKHGAVDRYTVYAKVKDNDILCAALGECPAETPVAIGRGALHDILLAHARKTVKYTALSMQDDLESEGATLDQIIQTAQQRIHELATQGGAKIKTLASDRQAKVDSWKAAQRGEGVVGIPTPWDLINDCLGGLRPRIMSVLGAYRGTGKSSMARQIVFHAAMHHGIPAALISLEDPSDIASAHIASMHGRFSPFHLDRGDSNVTPEQADREWQSIQHLPIQIYDRPSTISQIENACTAMVASAGAKLIVIDHIQYILPERNHKSRNEEVANYSMRLAALAKRLDCHILVCSQLSRDSEKNEREPRLSDLRDSGAIEQDARQVMLLYTDPETNIKDAQGNEHPLFILHVAKNNYGKAGDKIVFMRGTCPVAFLEREPLCK